MTLSAFDSPEYTLSSLVTPFQDFRLRYFALFSAGPRESFSRRTASTDQGGTKNLPPIRWSLVLPGALRRRRAASSRPSRIASIAQLITTISSAGTGRRRSWSLRSQYDRFSFE